MGVLGQTKKQDEAYLFIIISLLSFIFLEPLIGFNPAVIVAVFLIIHFFHLDSRVLFAFALGLLVVAAIAYSFGNQRLAEGAAVLVYYFLLIGVGWEIIELIK